MNVWPYVSIVVVVGLFYLLSLRARRRQVLHFEQETERMRRIGFGSEVMTTSGLYGVVVGHNDDDTVQLVISPGVEVKWALAALREIELPDPSRGGSGSQSPGESLGEI